MSTIPVEKRAIPAGETWNLSDLYPDGESFRGARDRVRRRVEGAGRFRGLLSGSAGVLADALEYAADLSRELGRLHSYVSLRSDVDTRVAEHQAERQEIELMYTDLSRRTSYLRPEILAMDPEKVERFLGEEPRLEPFAHFLRDLIRQREHVLGPAEERILSEAGLVTGAPPAVYNVFHNAEMPRPEFTLKSGETLRLTPAAFGRHRTSPDRMERRGLFRTYFEAYGAFRNTLGQNLHECLKTHLFRARVRRYSSCLEAALDGDRVPVTVYENLLASIRESLPVLHRYFKLRGRALGLDRLGYHDLHCPLVQGSPRRYTVGEARRLVHRSLEPLGGEYLAAMDTALNQRWIDWHPLPGKRSGAYASGAAYDVHPYILLNFNGDYESVTTLAHEGGHALHSYFSNRTQPYPTADYSIFVAEVASTFNEALLNRKMLEEAGTREERLFLLGAYLDGLRTTLFRQTMFAEFELEIHRRTEAGEVLTGDSLSDLYLRLDRAYHGHDQGVVEVADPYGVEWAAVPHFYYDFYVYQYATGIVAATALAEAVLSGAPGARDRYLSFLSAGGSDYPLEILRTAGVNLERPEPYRATVSAMEHALDLLEDMVA